MSNMMKTSHRLSHLIDLGLFLLLVTVNVVETNASIYVADLVALPGGASNLSGKAIVFGESNFIGYSGYVISVEESLTKAACSSPNACGAHIYNGTGCNTLAKQGERLYGTPITTDPWINKIYTSDSTGYGKFGDVLDIGGRSVKDRTFILTSSTGNRIACGVLKEIPDKSKVLTAELAPFSNSSKSGSVVAYRLTTSTNTSVLAADPRTDNICFFVEGRGLTPNLQSFLVNTSSNVCNITNGCGVHVHAGQSCVSAASQGGHYWDNNTFSDPWLLPGGSFLTTNNVGQTTYASCVATGKTKFEDQTFVLHESNGTRVACGLLQFPIQTPSPTPKGSPAPTLVDNGRNFSLCFSGSSTVEVENVGMIPISQLNIGDYVRGGNRLFTQVYGFGHMDHDFETEFLQIAFDDIVNEDARIEISPKHLVFAERENRQVAIRASDVVVGDILSGKKVFTIQRVTRSGVYTPWTQSGDLLVGDIRASSYVDILDQSLFLDQHTLSHAYMFPRRLFCHYFIEHCKKETYTNGYSFWAYYIIRLVSIINAYGWFASMIVSCVNVPVVAIMYVMESMTILGFFCVGSIVMINRWRKV